MLAIDVPGHAAFRFEHLVLDYNGTLALDGELIEGVSARLGELASRMRLHVLTADTFGRVRDALREIQCDVTIIGPEDQAHAKRAYIDKLSPAHAVAIGNGRNDRLMLQAATLGIVVIGPECAAVESFVAARVAAPDILAALDLLREPLRLVATLRN